MLVRSLLVASAAALRWRRPLRPPAPAPPRHRAHAAITRAADAATGRCRKTPATAIPENPYDPAYRGPGWEVFALQHGQERGNRLLHDVAPDAKISASGIVVGGD